MTHTCDKYDIIMGCDNSLEIFSKIHGVGVKKAKEVIRKYVDFLDIDRPLYPDHTNMKELVKSGEILEEIENLVGSLE